MFNRNKDKYPPLSSDTLIVWESEGTDADQEEFALSHVGIFDVDDVRNGTVYVTGRHAVPVADCHTANSPEGLIYLYRAPSAIVRETERLAKLEQSIVLQQITDYAVEPEHKSMDWTKVGLFVLLGLAMILSMSSCGA